MSETKTEYNFKDVEPKMITLLSGFEPLQIIMIKDNTLIDITLTITEKTGNVKNVKDKM